MDTRTVFSVVHCFWVALNIESLSRRVTHILDSLLSCVSPFTCALSQEWRFATCPSPTAHFHIYLGFLPMTWLLLSSLFLKPFSRNSKVQTGELFRLFIGCFVFLSEYKSIFDAISLMGRGKQYYLISVSSSWELELTSSQIPNIDFIGGLPTVLYIM